MRHLKKYGEWTKEDIMIEFYQDLEDFGIELVKDYIIYGDGLAVRIIFNKSGLKKLHL